MTPDERHTELITTLTEIRDCLLALVVASLNGQLDYPKEHVEEGPWVEATELVEMAGDHFQEA